MAPARHTKTTATSRNHTLQQQKQFFIPRQTQKPSSSPGIIMDSSDSSSDDSDFTSLIETIIQHMFVGKGYSEPEDWSYVNITDVQATCGFLKQPSEPSSNHFTEPSSSMMAQVNIECPINYVSLALESFLHKENLRYFYYYLIVALPLVTLAIVFNCLAVYAVSRVREKYLRHHVLISLSISDIILTVMLLLKRCSDPDVVGLRKGIHHLPNLAGGSNLTAADQGGGGDGFTMTIEQLLVVQSTVSGAWQVGYIMSALGIVCLSFDNVLAIVAPFFYEKLMVKPKLPKFFIGALWLGAVFAVILLHIFEVATSFGVQIAVCIIMLVLLLCTLVSYTFACTQAHLHQVRLAEQTGSYRDRRSNTTTSSRSLSHSVVGLELVTRTQFRGFLTTCLLVVSFLVCWSPLIGYLLHNEDSLASAHRFYNQYLCAALAVLHLNSVVDPVIYCLRMPDIRKSLFTILGCQRRPHLDVRYIPTNFNGHLNNYRLRQCYDSPTRRQIYKDEVMKTCLRQQEIGRTSTYCDTKNNSVYFADESNETNNGGDKESNEKDDRDVSSNDRSVSAPTMTTPVDDVDDVTIFYSFLTSDGTEPIASSSIHRKNRNNHNQNGFIAKLGGHRASLAIDQLIFI